MRAFNRPSEIISQQSKFANREVGLTHPDIFSYIRLADNGDIYIMAEDGLGIIISATKHCIFLVGDNVKFLTKEDEGLRWNNVSFNPKATKFAEPTFIYPKEQSNTLYDGIDHFLD